MGFKGGLIGGAVAIVLFGVLQAANSWLTGTAGGDEAEALFGSFSIGFTGYLAILGQIVLMALVTALASRQTVRRTLKTHRLSERRRKMCKTKLLPELPLL